MDWYGKLVKSGWLGSMPQISQDQESRKSWRDYTPDSTPDAVGEAIRRVRQKTSEKKDSES